MKTQMLVRLEEAMQSFLYTDDQGYSLSLSEAMAAASAAVYDAAQSSFEAGLNSTRKGASDERRA